MKKRIFILYAPTASGKTEASLLLGKSLPVEIISADSRQVFRYLDIGTAKASLIERSAVPHHCIDIVNPDEHYSAGRFRTDALKAIQEVEQRERIPIVVGGSGLYIQALFGALFVDEISTEEQARLAEIRDHLSERLVLEGRQRLYEELMHVDPISAQKYSDQNPSRILRALEYFQLKGLALSDAHRQQAAQQDMEPIVFVIDHDRDGLNKRIEARSNAMWESGLVSEVESILSVGYAPDVQALRSVGYKEALSYLNGTCSEQEAIALIAQNTKRYAKRQRTWARHQFNEPERLVGSSEEIAHSLEKSILKFYKP